jgi:hypothetical protein
MPKSIIHFKKKPREGDTISIGKHTFFFGELNKNSYLPNKENTHFIPLRKFEITLLALYCEIVKYFPNVKKDGNKIIIDKI